MQLMVRQADGAEVSLDAGDGVTVLTSLDGDFPLRIETLKIELASVASQIEESSQADDSCDDWEARRHREGLWAHGFCALCSRRTEYCSCDP